MHNRCIPYRLIEDSDEVNDQCDIENKIEVLMVSSPNRDDLVFPKVYNSIHSWLQVLARNITVLYFNVSPCSSLQGGWEDDETILEAACREAVEEAGVRGKLNVGFYISRSRIDVLFACFLFKY